MRSMFADVWPHAGRFCERRSRAKGNQHRNGRRSVFLIFGVGWEVMGLRGVGGLGAGLGVEHVMTGTTAGCASSVDARWVDTMHVV